MEIIRHGKVVSRSEKEVSVNFTIVTDFFSVKYFGKDV